MRLGHLGLVRMSLGLIVLTAITWFFLLFLLIVFLIFLVICGHTESAKSLPLVIDVLWSCRFAATGDWWRCSLLFRRCCPARSHWRSNIASLVLVISAFISKLFHTSWATRISINDHNGCLCRKHLLMTSWTYFIIRRRYFLFSSFWCNSHCLISYLHFLCEWFISL